MHYLQIILGIFTASLIQIIVYPYYYNMKHMLFSFPFISYVLHLNADKHIYIRKIK